MTGKHPLEATGAGKTLQAFSVSSSTLWDHNLLSTVFTGQSDSINEVIDTKALVKLLKLHKRNDSFYF